MRCLGLCLISFAAALAMACHGDQVHVSLKVGSSASTEADVLTILSILDSAPIAVGTLQDGTKFWGVQVKHVVKGTYGGLGCWELRTSGGERPVPVPVLGK